MPFLRPNAGIHQITADHDLMDDLSSETVTGGQVSCVWLKHDPAMKPCGALDRDVARTGLALTPFKASQRR